MTAPAHPDRQGTREELRDALRIHHPIMRSETGPFSGCRCGGVRLGQDVIAHVLDHMAPVVERLCDQRAAEALEAITAAWEAMDESAEAERLAGLYVGADHADLAEGVDASLYRWGERLYDAATEALSRPESAETHPSGTPGPPEHGTEALRAK